MKIVWDEPKRKINLGTRGLNFADLDLAFFAEATVIPAKLNRFKAIGMWRGIVLTVIFRPLGSEALSVISMPVASRQERNL